MTVKELIRELIKCDPDSLAVVNILGVGSGYDAVFIVRDLNVSESFSNSGFAGRYDEVVAGRSVVKAVLISGR